MFTIITSSQSTLNYVPLESFDPNDGFGDLASLDDDFSKALIIGMGESTHGTHEFFLNRHRVFKYLVEKHQFNTFFLEADYGSCLRINRYVNGAKDDLREVVKCIEMWPWETEEMESLIEWMRNYNESLETNDQLQFIGSDLQRVNSTIAEIDLLISKYNPELLDTSNYIELTENEFAVLLDPVIVQEYKRIIRDKKEKQKVIAFEGDDKFIFQTLIRHFEQIIEEKEKQKFANYRDLKMGENILYHLDRKPDIKGFFWAHNGHIANVYLPKRKESKSFYRAGGVLKNKLKEKYLIIGQDFDQGTFNAYNMTKSEKVNDKDEISNYTLGPVSVEQNEFLMAYLFKDVKESILYIRSSDFTKEHERKMYFNYIGASYNPPANKKRPSMMQMHQSYFDIVILIKNSTATKLIKR